MSGGVLLLTASMGAGHTTVAAELARRLDARGVPSETLDVLDLDGGERLRTTYRRLLRHAPWVYDAAMRFWARHPGPLTRLVALGSRAADRALGAAIAARRPSAVVSTYNLATQAVGRLAAAGRVTAPVLTLVTDPGPHPYWVSPHLEHYAVALPETAAGLRSYGARDVALSPPVVRPEFAAVTHAPGSGRRRVLVTSGSWAAGRVERTVAELAAASDVETTVLCARDESLRRRVAALPGVTALGWTGDVAGLLARSDVVVDNAGGLTCWEAIAAGTRVVLHDPLPGHGRVNAAALAAAGLVRVTRDGDALRIAVRDRQPAPRRHAWGDPPVEERVLGLLREAKRAHA